MGRLIQLYDLQMALSDTKCLSSCYQRVWLVWALWPCIFHSPLVFWFIPRLSSISLLNRNQMFLCEWCARWCPYISVDYYVNSMAQAVLRCRSNRGLWYDNSECFSRCCLGKPSADLWTVAVVCHICASFTRRCYCSWNHLPFLRN